MKTFTYTTRHKILPGDLHTPVSTYLKMRDLFPQSILLESSDYHGVENNRSFIGLNPIASFSVNHGTVTTVFPDKSREEEALSAEFRVEDAFRKFLGRFRVEGEYARYGGVYGYTTFNAIRYFEQIPVKDSRDPKNDAPEILYILYKYLIVFNEFQKRDGTCGISGKRRTEPHRGNRKGGQQPQLYHVCLPCRRRNHQYPDRRRTQGEYPQGNCPLPAGRCIPDRTSRRFIQRYEGDDFTLYRALRSINPSPYLFYFDFGGFRIFGSSPETHCKIEDGKATIDPLPEQPAGAETKRLMKL